MCLLIRRIRSVRAVYGLKSELYMPLLELMEVESAFLLSGSVPQDCSEDQPTYCAVSLNYMTETEY